MYCHTNKENGKKYIGITGRNVNKRWRNGKGYPHNQYFTNAINKYGWKDGFLHEILEENLTLEEAKLAEKNYISTYNTIYPNGYNFLPGGEEKGNYHMTEETRKKISESLIGKLAGEKHPFYGTHRSDETKLKISEATKGKVVSEESKKKMSDAKKGKYAGSEHPMYGKSHTEEVRQKISNSLKGKYTGEKSHMYGKHPSDETRAKMSASRKGKSLSEETKKKISEANMGRVMSEETKQKLSEANKGKPHRPLTDEEKIHLSEILKGKEVSEKTRQKISTALTGVKFSPERVQKMIDNAPIVKPVYCYELNSYYKGVSDAKRQTGVDHRHIQVCCKGDTNRKSAGKHPITGEKLHWRYATIEEYNEYLMLQEKGND